MARRAIRSRLRLLILLSGMAVLCIVLLVAIPPLFGRGHPMMTTQIGAAATSPLVTGVTAVHRNGQTFITWREIGPAPPEQLTSAEYLARRRELNAQRIRYRVFRSDAPATRLSDATLIGEVLPLSIWNGDYYGVYPRPGAVVPRYAIEEGQPPLSSGTGLFVFNTKAAARSYYYVTVSMRGTENAALNAASTAVVDGETEGPGSPVLQRVDHPPTFIYVDNPTLRYYVRWEPPGNSNPPGKPFDYLVAIPPYVKYPAPVGIHLHEWGASMNGGFGWWNGTQRASAILVATNQVPYDWWTGYHEHLWTRELARPEDWQRGVVRPYTQTRILSFVDWLATTMQLDLRRTFTAGSSMGGSGAIMFAIRHPSRIAWAISWVGVHNPRASSFRNSYAGVYGQPEWEVKFEDGTSVWDYYNDIWYLRRYPDRDIGYITFANGKNDHPIGWPQAVQFLKALQETRQPHMFVWGQEGHGQRAIMPGHGGQRFMPIDLRTDQSLPAFSRSSLDDDPGSGPLDTGDPQGQVNAHLIWETDSLVDEPSEWSVVVKVGGRSPRPEGIVDVTPRRLQRFKISPGETLEWTNRRGKEIVQSGDLIADRWGLATMPEVRVGRDGARITLRRKPS